LAEFTCQTGTKEGCNEGDCGACTVMVTDERGSRSVNACILLMPQIHGKAVRTVEGISGPGGELHPVQEAMVEHHGSQCGFCTPGFVVSMAVAHQNGQRDFDTRLAGNLCRCTGYAPIVRAAEAAADVATPEWMVEDLSALDGLLAKDTGIAMPQSSDELADWYENNPDGVLIGGATDIGLWVTKRLDELGNVAFLSGVADLTDIEVTDQAISVGACASVSDFGDVIAEYHPDFAKMVQRYGSVQVRNAATIGGNIANGSPIGDGPPALIALGASLHLRKGAERREIPLEDFYIEYGKQDREPGEFVERITIPRQVDRLKCYKISKRFDQDISAVCGCFSIAVEDGKVVDARIAFGGMAGTPHRAASVEKALNGAAWTRELVENSMQAFDADYTPMSDMRASADYRMATAKNLLLRYFLEDQDQSAQVSEVDA
jgi:xanthine dehydrogenase small subunit